MLLYRGSNLDIKTINLSMCRPYKDFGTGYYLTDLQEQAVNMAKRVSREWAAFVMNNRNRTFTEYQSPECNLDNKYDIVAGPVADDNIAMLFRQFQNGFIDFDALTKGMTYKKLTSQYSFHTPKALSLLQKVGIL